MVVLPASAIGPGGDMALSGSGSNLKCEWLRILAPRMGGGILRAIWARCVLPAQEVVRGDDQPGWQAQRGAERTVFPAGMASPARPGQPMRILIGIVISFLLLSECRVAARMAVNLLWARTPHHRRGFKVGCRSAR